MSFPRRSADLSDEDVVELLVRKVNEIAFDAIIDMDRELDTSGEIAEIIADHFADFLVTHYAD